MALDNIERQDKFFEKILRKALEDNSIRDVKLIEKNEATSKGQNFMSAMFRLSLKYSCFVFNDDSCKKIEKNINLIVKEEPIDPLALEHTRGLNLFGRELAVLENILPTIENLVGDKIGPKCIWGSADPPSIMMEDLAALGFKNKSRKVGFAKSHTLMVIETYAKLHAGSVKMNEKQPGFLPTFTNNFITETKNEKLLSTIEDSVRIVGEVIRNWSDKKCAKAAPKLEKLATKILSDLREAPKYDEDEFCVLNHGDCWINNIMFRENANKEPLEVRLVDFQMSFWSSPAMDLSYFLSICPEPSIKCDLYDFCLDHYLKILGDTMKKIGCKTRPPTINELHKSIAKRRCQAVMTGLVFYPRVAAEDSVQTMDDILEKGTSDLSIFDNPSIVSTLKKFIPWLDERGFLD